MFGRNRSGVATVWLSFELGALKLGSLLLVNNSCHGCRKRKLSVTIADCYSLIFRVYIFSALNFVTMGVKQFILFCQIHIFFWNSRLLINLNKYCHKHIAVNLSFTRIFKTHFVREERLIHIFSRYDKKRSKCVDIQNFFEFILRGHIMQIVVHTIQNYSRCSTHKIAWCMFWYKK